MTAQREDLLYERDVAKWLAVSTRTIRKLRQSGKLRYVPAGRAIRYDPQDVRAYIESAKQCASISEQTAPIGNTRSASTVVDFSALRAKRRTRMQN